MVPTIQNSMKPFKVSGQAPPWWGGGQLGVAQGPAELCLLQDMDYSRIIERLLKLAVSSTGG